MKIKNKIISLFNTTVLVILLTACSTYEDVSSGNYQTTCGTYNGHQLYSGPKGGCYYINANNNKTYVDRSYCNCN